MKKGLSALGLLALSSTNIAALDNQIIQSEAAKVITLAGRIGEAAMFAVQADDDDDLEVIATGSSNINFQNDQWILLDWNGSGYDVVNSGPLQSPEAYYLSGHQVSYSEVLLGQKNGLFTRISFSDDQNSTVHTITENTNQLSNLTHSADPDTIDSDIKSIVSLTGSDQNNYTIVCTEENIHVLNNNDLEPSIPYGGACQKGNLDYVEISPGVYDEELVTQYGRYLTFNGSQWSEKTDLISSNFGDNFKVTNIDDDINSEILSQAYAGQLQSYSPISGSWIYISSIRDANRNFAVYDEDNDGFSEIIFDQVLEDSDPLTSLIKTVSWDNDTDAHYEKHSITAPYLYTAQYHYLPTRVVAGIPQDYFLLTSNDQTYLPSTGIISRLAPDFSNNNQSLISNANRSFDALTKVGNTNSISDYNLVQLEQYEIAEETYEYAYKFLSGDTMGYDQLTTPAFNANQVIKVDSLYSLDLNADGIDELNAGGQADYLDPKGIIVSSFLDGTDYNTILTPTIESVSGLYVGDFNIDGANTPDFVASGKNNGEEGGIGIHIHEDMLTDSNTWFSPGSGSTEFKQILASDIKGDNKLEIVGLHEELSSYNPNSQNGESKFYNLGNLDIEKFSPIKLFNREYEYALASDNSGFLYLIEPKDFDKLATIEACESKIEALASVRISNNVDVALAVCDGLLKSWVIELDPSKGEYGYSFYQLANRDLENINTTKSQLLPLKTDDQINHLFAVFNNAFIRYELDSNISNDDDGDTYENYKDSFPNEITQWLDDDLDGLGDNPLGVLPDPSLNDIDNDGVVDNLDIDNIPENDFDFTNDHDQGLPTLVDSLTTVNLTATGELTPISLLPPSANDVYDEFAGNGLPAIFASTATESLTLNNGSFETSLSPGPYIVSWTAQDTTGNTSLPLFQEVNVYPTVSFTASSSTIGETQSAEIEVKLSGESPVYPFDVTIQINNSSTTDNDDFSEDLSSNLVVTFQQGDTVKTVSIEAINDNTTETPETLELTLLDTFNANTWAIDPASNTYSLEVADYNFAPTASLTISQNGVSTNSPTISGGLIELDVTTLDVNAGDGHTYLWDLTELGFGNSLLEDVSFNPINLETGTYTVSLIIIDNGLPNALSVNTFNISLEYGDIDADGVNDNLDAFPNNPDEQLDSDGDGVGDNEDEMPFDATELFDSDNDGVGDNADEFPNDSSRSNSVEEQEVASALYYLLLLLLPLLFRRTK